MKSKKMKQEEAIARKRQGFSKYTARYVEAAAKSLADPSNEYLKSAADQEKRNLDRAARGAHVDTHGNPIDGGMKHALNS